MLPRSPTDENSQNSQCKESRLNTVNKTNLASTILEKIPSICKQLCLALYPSAMAHEPLPKYLFLWCMCLMLSELQIGLACRSRHNTIGKTSCTTNCDWLLVTWCQLMYLGRVLQVCSAMRICHQVDQLLEVTKYVCWLLRLPHKLPTPLKIAMLPSLFLIHCKSCHAVLTAQITSGSGAPSAQYSRLPL